MNATATDYEQQAQAFLDKHGIKFKATLSDTKVAPWDSDRADHERNDVNHHYRVTLSKSNYEGAYDIRRDKPKRLVFDFWDSFANAKAGIKTVTAYDVLSCISGDVHCPETFEDFCAEYGYKKDSIKALQTFRRCSAFEKRLRTFFTAKEIEELSEIQ